MDRERQLPHFADNLKSKLDPCKPLDFRAVITN